MTRVRRYAIALLLPALLGGCGRGAPVLDAPALYAMLQSGDLANALPAIKAYVVAHPVDPAGHWLLAKAHAAGGTPLHGHTFGEYRIALGLERANGGIGELESVLSADDFRYTAYEESAYALVAWVVHARQLEMPVAMVLPHLREAMDAVDGALAIKSEAPDLLQLRERIAWYLERDGHLGESGTA